MLALTLAVGCATTKHHADTWIAKHVPQVEGVWEYPGGEAHAMRVIFRPGGRLIFENGFEFYNPARWEYNPNRDELRITITVPKGDDLSALQYHAETGRIKRIDAEQGQIYYDFREETVQLNFSGWEFFKK